MRALLVTIVLLAAGCLGPAADDAVDPTSVLTDAAPVVAFSQIHTPEEIVALLADLTRLPGVDAGVIGTSVEGRPLHLVTVGEGPFDLWIVGRHHGNEPTGGEAILLMLQVLADPDAEVPDDAPASVRALRDHRDVLLDRITFHFVPVVNPDGAAAFQRGNAHGTDLNREYALFTEPEPRAVRDAFWTVWPDGCLDLHNEGLGSTDWDAFNPDGPLLEVEPRALMFEDIWYALREVDAAGGNGGDANENYNVAEDTPMGDIVNPTAYHPGTHDMFCTLRGAPGWTPEGTIEGLANGDTGDVAAWSTRLHQVTVASTAFHWAGLYDGVEPFVWKERGTASPTGTVHAVTLADPGRAMFQVVWKETSGVTDWNAAPMTFSVGGPDGDHDGRAPAPGQWTSTVLIEEAAGGSYTLAVTGPVGAEYEVRAYLTPDADDLVAVTRDADGLVVKAAKDASVRLTLTDVGDAPLPSLADVTPSPTNAGTFVGSVGTRAILEWELTLEPGEEVRVDHGLTGVGPFRWKAVSGERVQTGVEDARNPS